MALSSSLRILLLGGICLLTWIAVGNTPGQSETAAKAPEQSVNSNYVIHKNILYKIEQKTLTQIASVENDPYLSSDDYVVTLSEIDYSGCLSCPGQGSSHHGKVINIHKIEKDSKLKLYRKITLPEGYTVKTTALHKGILFVTGNLGENIFGFYDIRSENPKFVSVQVPAEVKQKMFDDLIIDGNTLLAVDNVVWPKWLVLFDISRPKDPKTLKVVELMEGVNEHIEKGVVGNNYLVLFAENSTKGGRRQALQIYSKSENYKPLSEITLWRWSRQSEEETGQHSTPVMSFMDDILILSGHGKGVGVIDCSSKIIDKSVLKPLLYTNEKKRSVPVVEAVVLPNNMIAIKTEKTAEFFIVSKNSLSGW